MAFTQNQVPTFGKQPNNGHVQIVNGTGTGQVTGYTAGANGSKILGVIVASDDSSNETLQMSVLNSTTYLLMVKQILANSGNSNGVPPVNMFNTTDMPGLPVDNDNNPFLILQSGDTLVFNTTGTITSGKHINIHVIAVDF